MKTFKFNYRNEFNIIVEAVDKEEAENYLTNSSGKATIVLIEPIFEGLHPCFLELDEEDE